MTTNNRPNVKAGQTWYSTDNPSKTCKITKIVNSVAYAISPDGFEKPFGLVNNDDVGISWPSSWVCKEDVEPQTEAKSSIVSMKENNSSLFAFFKATRPGNCPCDIPVDKCKYHKT